MTKRDMLMKHIQANGIPFDRAERIERVTTKLTELQSRGIIKNHRAQAVSPIGSKSAFIRTLAAQAN